MCSVVLILVKSWNHPRYETRQTRDYETLIEAELVWPAVAGAPLLG